MGKMDYSLADLHFCLDAPFELEITKESKEFLICYSDVADDSVKFVPVDEIEEIPAGGYWHSLRYYVRTAEGYKVYYCYKMDLKPFALVEYMPDNICFYYVPTSREIAYKSYCILNMLGLEYLLLRHKGLILHSSFIHWKNMGILFSAPSGTGKSTQAELWKKYMGADIINGDRACIRKADGIWRAYGLPYAGSSKIYRNESAPLSRIVVLRQGAENKIRPLKSREAIHMLMSELTIHSWDSIYISETLNIVIELLEKIPVYLLICRPDREAVDVLYETMKEEVTD